MDACQSEYISEIGLGTISSNVMVVKAKDGFCI